MTRIKKSVVLIAFLMSPVLVVGCQSNDRKNEASAFFYSDLSRFQDVIDSIDSGGEPQVAFEEYLEDASPGLVGWSGRYRVSAERFAELYGSHAAIFKSLPLMEEPLRTREAETDKAIARLRELAQSDEFFYVYYFVSSQHRFAGTPIFTPGGQGEIGVGIALGANPDSPEIENPEQFPYNDTAADLTYLVVHEAAHILQLRAQGRENYLSIYAPGGGTMLSIAVREGCAEYVTYLSLGRRFGDRHLYLAEHEESLWTEFQQVAAEDAFSVPGWFDGRADHDPDRPYQIGYDLGFEMCRAYHLEADDREQRAKEIFAMYDSEAIKQIAAAYSRALSERTETSQ